MALIEVINDHGTVLIDDNYSNATLVTKGQITLQPTPAGTTNYYVEINWTSAQPVMLALELTGAQVQHLFTNRSGNNWNFVIHFNGDQRGAVVPYYIFTIPSAIPNAGGMVQLFNAAGQIVFDSNLKYMRVHGFFPTTLNNSTVECGMAAGRVYAVVSVMGCYFNMHQRANPLEYAPPYTFNDISGTGLLSRSGTAMVCTYKATATYTNQKSDRNEAWNRQVPNGQALIIDVTNY